ncbi:hypothetical protein [Actinoplanes couchii]|uniref:Flavin reductase n=1 Tax=Actinoplanes couchii TaxID=403638 RepID=A0ABQ3X9P6_9ACTN|nr:hypothetical protein [Actinoplanes couchii]MDR6325593.1 hypothetical protein [Actinoplanes couchii]GID55238.1 hypothetical protein Aco03nite_036420 [Actinoplanes couchii]
MSTIPVPEHLSDRPHWLCRVCGEPWPCPEARASLLSEYRAFPSLLKIYMTTLMYAAMRDLTIDDVPSPAELHDRFLTWAQPPA